MSLKQANRGIFFMKDRITAGLISGLIAGIAMNIIDWLGVLIGFHQERLLNWAAIAVLGRLPNTIAEIIFAQFAQLVFSGLLGVLFSVILLSEVRGNYLVKGWLFGLAAWFTIYAISIALRLPTLEQHTLNATTSHFVSSSVYGLILTVTLNRLAKTEVEN
jgi:hypothetical protein